MNDLAGFSQATRSWFDDAFHAPTPVQLHGWQAIQRGAHTLLVAPTGSGKTLAAFLAGVDYCLTLPAAARAGRRRAPPAGR